MVWMYRKDVFEANRDRMQQDLGFDPMPNGRARRGSSTTRRRSGSRRTSRRASRTAPGHQAKQHDSLMNDFSNVLWAYGGDYFDDGVDVGRFGSDDPGEPRLDSDRRRSRPPTCTASCCRSRTRRALSWDWTGLGEAFQAGQVAMAVEWHEFAGGFETSKIAGKVGYAPLPKGPKRRACMYGGTAGSASTATPSKDEQKAAWLFVNWATSPETQLANLKSKVGGGTPTRESIYELPEVKAAMNPPSEMPNIALLNLCANSFRNRMLSSSVSARRGDRGLATSAKTSCAPLLIRRKHLRQRSSSPVWTERRLLTGIL